jgi:predicted GNAT family N-acyltransferase
MITSMNTMINASHFQRIYTVSGRTESTNDANEVEQISYTLRGLREDEIGIWTEFCASVFAYKVNPPLASYFARHYYHDPDRVASWIRVAIDNQSQTIVASCRIFRRCISLGSRESNTTTPKDTTIATAFVHAGGIGEVCTDNRHRRRGLSRELLQDTIRIMELDGTIRIAFLHAAPDFFPVYEKMHFQCVSSGWCQVQMNRDILKSVSQASYNTTRFHVRKVDWDTDTLQLAKVHHQYSELRFCGCIIRSKSYWDEYIRLEVDSAKLMVACNDDKLLGWLLFQNKGGKIRVQDFGFDQSLASELKLTSYELFASLKESVVLTSEVEAQFCWENETFSILLPSMLYEEMKQDWDMLLTSSNQTQLHDSYITWNATGRADDYGWMYRPIGASGVDLQTVTEKVPHWIWPSDFF